MSRQAQAVLLLLLGGVLLKISLTGGYLHYVRASLGPLLACAGAVTVLVGLVACWQDLRAHRHRDDHDHDHDDDGHHHGSGRIGWLLLAPACALLLVTPSGVGSYTAGRTGTALAAGGRSSYPPLSGADPAPLSLLDYASRAVYDHGHSLTGHRVRLTGFVTAGPHGARYLTRMVITCCAADARPVKVGLTGAAPTDLPADAWISADGRYDAHTDTDPVNHEQVPYLDVQRYQRIAVPRQQYES